MAFALYKPGQGKWARGVGAAGLCLLGIWGSLETYGWLVASVSPASSPFYANYVVFIVPGLILACFLWAAYYIANRPKPTDFIIETELEMRKVTWPTTREVLGATVVVIVVVILMGLYMFAVDRGIIQPLFQWIGILPNNI